MPFIELGLLWIKEFALYQPRLLLRELQSKHLLQEDRFETLNILWEITVVTVRGNVPRQTLWTHQSLYTLLTSSGISAELQVNDWMTNSLQNNGCVQNHSTIWSLNS